MIIKQKRINNVNILKSIKDLSTVRIGISVTADENKKLGVDEFEAGITILPAPAFGVNCKRNANGYTYPDKTKEKKPRIINTIEWTWEQWASGGTTETCSKFVDIIKKVYQRINVDPTLIELSLVNNGVGDKFIIANLKMHSVEDDAVIIKQTINMFLEIFGWCQIFDKDLEIVDIHSKIKRCNWILLPQGIRVVIEKQKQNARQIQNSKRSDFNQYRLDKLESYKPVLVGEGINGMLGYYAYVYNKTCFLENAKYGNATYIIPKKDWEQLTKLSKRELLDANLVIEKVIHCKEWVERINVIFNRLEKNN